MNWLREGTKAVVPKGTEVHGKFGGWAGGVPSSRRSVVTVWYFYAPAGKQVERSRAVYAGWTNHRFHSQGRWCRIEDLREVPTDLERLAEVGAAL